MNLYVQLSETGQAQPVAEVKEKILAYCRKHLAAYKVPKVIHIVAEIPLTPVGKIDKKALRH